MSAPPEVTGRKFLKKRSLAVRYGKSSLKTIDRWVKAGVLPEPDFEINGIAYWSESRLEEADRKRTAAAGAGKGVKRLPNDQPANSESPTP